MSCPYSREDLSAYVDAEVDEVTQAAIREHVRACSTCKREVAWLETLKQMVANLPRLESDTAITWSAERHADAPCSMLHCPVVLPEASALIDDELPPDAAQTVLVHLTCCEPCYRAYKDLERISEVMAGTEPAPVPAGLEARIVAAVEAERGVTLRSLFSRTCECVAPVGRVSLRFAAAAALVLAVLLGVWQAIAPRGEAPAAVVVAPTAAVAAVPAVPNEPGPPSIETTPGSMLAQPDRRRPATSQPVLPPSTPPTTPSPAVVRPIVPPAGGAPTVLRPPGGVPVAPGLAGPGRATPPQPGLAPPPSMLASLPPSQPTPSTEPDTPAMSKPPLVPGKSTPGTGEVAPPRPPAPVRMAEHRVPDDETDTDLHVRVPRSSPGGSAGADSRGIDPRNLRAAEARATDLMKSATRSRPKRFSINP